MKFPILNIEGSKSETIEISDKLVKLKVNYKLIKYVIDWQLNHAKPRTAKTKQRNVIKGSTKKIIAENKKFFNCDSYNTLFKIINMKHQEWNKQNAK